jgi:predicted hotdog family 3-hydroxylacyl-ACP dehydratase
MIDIEVAELLPHDGNMVLLDGVVDYDQESLVAEVVVRDDGLFGDGKTIPAWIGIEYMAQTVAAHGGMMCHLVGKPINLGFLLGTLR